MEIKSIKRPGQTSQGKVYTSNAFYLSKPWRELRARKLRESPNCVTCGKPGQMVDHIQRIEAGGLKLDMANLQTMCNHCHNVKRACERNEKYKK